eukprot:328734-Hanusia_phi.AAC.8
MAGTQPNKPQDNQRKLWHRKRRSGLERNGTGVEAKRWHCSGLGRYMAPEVFNKQDYSNKADIWSLGCVLFELLTLNHPTYEKDKRIWFEWVLAVPTLAAEISYCLA